MTAAEILSHVRSLGAKLWVEGDRLRFSAPEGALTAALRGQLAEHKQDIIAFLRRAKAAAARKAPPLKRIFRDRPLPLSLAQERLWVLEQLLPGTPSYNMAQAVRLQGGLDVPALRRTFEEIVARHEVLRTTYPAVHGRPVPAIAQDFVPAIPIVDLEALPEAERMAVARRLAREESRRPFDLHRGPLIRTRLVRLGPEDHVMLCTMHHLVSDGWSMGILVEEIAALYGAFSQRRRSPLADPAIQYADFAHWQRQWLAGEVLQSQLSYWKQLLEGAPPLLELPLDRPRPAVQTFRGAHWAFGLSESLSRSLSALSRQEDVTLFMTLLAAFQTLLHLWTGQDDIVVGTPVANRNRVEVEKLIGFFVNILALRTGLSGDLTFRELLQRVRGVTLDAYAHQDVPLERLLDALHVERGLSHAPLVQVGFALQNATAAALEVPGLTIRPLRLDNGTAKTDLVLFVSQEPAGLNATFEYNTDLFSVATIARLAEAFQALLEAVVADPGQRLSRLAGSAGPALVSGRSSASVAAPASPKADLTRQQHLIWMDQKLHPDVPLYNVAATCTFSVNADPAHFEKAFQTLVNSSDALRTIIEETDGVPQRRVCAEMPCRMQFHDFSHAPDPDAMLAAWARGRAGACFDLEERLFEVALVKLSEDRSACFLNQHHLITDGWSCAAILRCLSDFYERSLRGDLPGHVALPPFEGFVDAEAAYEASPRHRRAESYWSRQRPDDGDPPSYYGAVRGKKTTAADRLSVTLDPQRAERLRALAGQEKGGDSAGSAALFTLVASALLAFLHRISDRRELALGIPVHNRRSAAFKKTIGLLLQVCPLRISLAADETFASLKDKVAAILREIVRYGQCAVRNPHQRPAYDVVLNYHREAFEGFGGAPVEIQWIHPGHGHESLALHVRDFGASGRITLDFDFHRDVFAHRERAQVIEQFLRTCDALLENPSQPVAGLNLLSPEEEDRLLFELNRTGEPLPDLATIGELFGAQARKAPDRLAVTLGDQCLTYGWLDERAGRLAARLRAQGVGPETLVAVLAQRGCVFLGAILAVFKAGGAYVPLDPSWPPARIAEVVRRSGSRVVLTTDECRDQALSALDPMPPEARPAVLTIACDGDGSHGGGETHVPSFARNLAYVIYTSGSTGVPKGAMVEQSGMINHVQAKIEDLGLTGADIVAQTASQCFDISVWQFLAPLAAGAGVRVVADDVMHDPRQLLRVVEEERVTVLEIVPSLLRALLETLLAMPSGERPGLSALRWLIVTGEALPPDLCRLWLQAYPQIPMMNAYGPTECSDDVTHHVIDRAPPTGAACIPIGRPLRNMRMYVLDRQRLPAPLGAAAELHVGGVGVGRGYLNDPGRTAETFVPDPFGRSPGDRLYRTGDRVRYQPEGALEFLGRIDDQVKIRGFRIELGEIETVLGEHPAVKQAVVTVRQDAPGQDRLAAYLVPRGEQLPGTGEMRRFLQQRLPDYMIPSAFVALDAIPLTPNGKLDRRALPEPNFASPLRESGFVAPRTRQEQCLAGIWTHVLGIERIGVDDNFFELGGDSMKSIEIVARATQAGLRLTPQQFFQHPTIAGLAQIAQAGPSSGSAQGQATGAVPLTPIQHAFFGQRLPEPHHWNWSFLREVPRGLDPSMIEQALAHLVRHHDALRLRFRPSASGWRQAYAEVEDRTPFSVIDLAQVPQRARTAVLEAAAAALQASLHLSQGPLLRVAHFDCGRTAPGRVLIVFHHLVVDVISSRILLEDFQTVFEQLLRKQPPELPSKTTSFQSWSRRLTEYAQSGALRRELDFWTAMLAPAAGATLPLDHPGGRNTEASGDVVLESVGRDETRALLRDIPARCGAQIQEVLLTSLVKALGAWTGRRTLLVDLEGHGRESPLEEVDISRTVGWFTTVFPAVLDLGAEGRPMDELRSIQRRLREIPHRGIGYGALRFLSADENVRRAIRALPAAEVNFNYLGQMDQKLSQAIPFRFAAERKGPERSLRGTRAHPLYIAAGVRDGVLRIHWNFSTNLHERATIEDLGRRHAEELRTLIATCLAPTAPQTVGDSPWSPR